MSQSQRVTPLRPAGHVAPRPDGEPALRRVFVRDLVLLAEIGVYRREQGKKQRVRVAFDLAVEDPPGSPTDRLKDVVDYAKIVEAVRARVAAGRVNLVETLAEHIAACCLADPRVQRARVTVEKLDALADGAVPGVEIERGRPEKP